MRCYVTNCPALTTITIVVFSVVVGYTSVLSIAPSMIRYFGFHENQVGLKGGILVGAYFLGATVNALWGFLSDRVGRRFVFAASLIGVAASFVVTGVIVSFKAAIICRVVGGAFDARGVAFAAVDDISMNEEERVFAMGVLTITWQLAYCVGPLMAGSLADLSLTLPILHNFPFLLGGIVADLLCLISLVFVIFYFAEDPSEERIRLLSDKEMCRQTDVQKVGLMDGEKMRKEEKIYEGTESQLENKINDQKDVLKNGHKDGRDDKVISLSSLLPPKNNTDFFVLILIVVLHTLFYFFSKARIEAVLLWGGLKMAHGGLGLSSSKLGLIVGISSLASIPFSLFINPLIIERLGVRNTTLLFAILTGAVNAVFPTIRLITDPESETQKAIGLVTVLAFSSVGSTVIWQNISLLVNDWSPPQLLGAVNGITASLGMVTSALGPFAFGAIISANDSDVVGIPRFWEYGMVFMVLMGLHGLLAIGLYFVPKKSPRD